jgi:20S proteasome subunit alpha 7
MMIGGTDKRIFSVNANVGCTINGLTPDGKALMYRAREEGKQY